MKRTSRLLSVSALSLLLGSIAVNAQNGTKGFYGKFDAGGTITSPTDVSEIFGPVRSGAEVKFNPGARFGLTGGYNVTDWFASELEFGMSLNEVDSITGARDVDVALINSPILLNIRLQLPNPSVIRPYIGAGVGTAISIIDIENLEYGYRQLWGSASDVVFAWQAFAGIRFLLNESMSIGAEYRYVFTGSPSFETDYGHYWNISSDNMTFGDIQTHAFSLIFNYEF